MKILQLVGIVVLVYLATAALFFFVGVTAKGLVGGGEAIDMFFPYLSIEDRSNMTDFLISLLQGE